MSGTGARDRLGQRVYFSRAHALLEKAPGGGSYVTSPHLRHSASQHALYCAAKVASRLSRQIAIDYDRAGCAATRCARGPRSRRGCGDFESNKVIAERPENGAARTPRLVQRIANASYPRHTRFRLHGPRSSSTADRPSMNTNAVIRRDRRRCDGRSDGQTHPAAVIGRR